MNRIKRLFKKKIEGDELDELIFALEKSKEFYKNVFSHIMDKYTDVAYGKLDTKKEKKGISFELYLTETHFLKGDYKNPIKKTFSYEEIEKNPILKKYIKHKGLESSLSIISIASVLASAFFLSNNITGNAILTATPNSSGIIGAGLFVLGLVSFVIARNI
ncbi:hypothetical protein HYS72_00940 [Candidatus Pacearchaeota archaeon]|nr:hypothetical protein [Candidatus Pacearchaeota archaeon]